MAIETAYIRGPDATATGLTGLSADQIRTTGPNLYWVGPWACQAQYLGKFGPVFAWRVRGVDAQTFAAATGYQWMTPDQLGSLLDSLRGSGKRVIRRISDQAVLGVVLDTVFAGEDAFTSSLRDIGQLDQIDDMEEIA